jgi:hypothetical protein
MGLSSLDVDTTAEEEFAPGRGTASSEYEAAKRAAGIPTESQPRSLNIGRGRGLGGLLGGQVYAARFRLDALSAELLDPLSDLLGKKNYLFRGDQPSSLDCLAFGYLSLLVYPPVPQAWLRETIRAKYPRIGAYVHRLHRDLFHEEEVSPTEIWAVSTGISNTATSTKLPWTSRHKSLGASALACAKEILGNIPGIATLSQRHTIVASEPMVVSKRVRSELPSPLYLGSLFGVATAAAVGLASWAIHHRRSPREGELIFWALRPASGLGEAGSILSVFANQLHDEAMQGHF